MEFLLSFLVINIFENLLLNYAYKLYTYEKINTVNTVVLGQIYWSILSSLLITKDIPLNVDSIDQYILPQMTLLYQSVVLATIDTGMLCSKLLEV